MSRHPRSENAQASDLWGRWMSKNKQKRVRLQPPRPRRRGPGQQQAAVACGGLFPLRGFKQLEFNKGRVLSSASPFALSTRGLGSRNPWVTHTHTVSSTMSPSSTASLLPWGPEWKGKLRNRKALVQPGARTVYLSHVPCVVFFSAQAQGMGGGRRHPVSGCPSF